MRVANQRKSRKKCNDDVIVGYFQKLNSLSAGDPICLASLSLWLQAPDNAENENNLIAFTRYRLQGRFLNTVAEPQGKLRPSASGFAAVALGSLLIETLGCFMHGLPGTMKSEWPQAAAGGNMELLDEAEQRRQQLLTDHWDRLKKTDQKARRPKSMSEAIFAEFFDSPTLAGSLASIDGVLFYKHIRCGLLHQGETKHNWFVSRTTDGNTNGRITIPAESLVGCLLSATDSYLNSAPTNTAKRTAWLAKLRFVEWQSGSGGELS